MNRSLYDIHPMGSKELNMIAHPGGGTEVNEVPSFEGLVEDQFEAHLRHLEVAYKEPVNIRMAQLARELEGSGLNKMAASVDALSYGFLNKVAEELNVDALKKSMIGKLTEVERIVRKEKLQMFGVEGLSGAEDYILNNLSEAMVELDSDTTNFSNVIRNMNELLAEELLYGSYSQVGEADLESYMSNNNFKAYKTKLEAVREQAKLGRTLPATKPTTPERGPAADPRVQSRQKAARNLYVRAKGLYETLSDINNNAKTVASLRGDAAAQKINFVFGNPDLHSQLRDFYKRYQELDKLSEGSGLTDLQAQQYSGYLNKFQRRLNELEKYVDRVSSEVR